MKKGQTGVIVILLIIVVIAVIVILPQIQNLIPTGNGPVTPEYKNDVITVEQIHVLPSNPYAGSVITIGFNVKSNAEFVIPSTEVNFFDLKGLEIVNEISCDGGAIEYETDEEGKKIEAKCIFTDDKQIDPGDFKLIELTLRTPGKDLITSETPMTISYYVKYDYYGYRVVTIPVIDGTTSVRPSGKFDQSTATYGPIVLDFELPAVSEREEDGRIIKEYWVVGTIPFELKMNFRHVGSNLGITEPVTIKQGKAILRATSLQRGKVGEDEFFPCDFDDGGIEEIEIPSSEPGGECSTCLDVRTCRRIPELTCGDGTCPSGQCCCVETTGVRLSAVPRHIPIARELFFAPASYRKFTSKKDFEVPKELICNFQAVVGSDPAFGEISASINAEFDYTYKYTRTETFTVRPIPEE